MNPKKLKEKERRRARKLADEAWDAVNEQNLDLAEKIIRRAVTTQVDNPVLWNDQAMILALRGKDREAEEAFRSAISLAPTYAEPFARLAALRAKQGYLLDAVRFMEQAVQHSPTVVGHAERLASYRALIECQKEPTPIPEAKVTPVQISSDEEKYAAKVATLNWAALGQQLTETGCALIPAFLEPPSCGQIRRMFEENVLFAKTVVMERDDFGRGVYRYFKGPIPTIVDGIRRAIYPPLARIVNEWQTLLNEPERFPANWEDFRRRCEDAGQSTPTPILLKYGPSGFNALHRDLRGSVYFPIQLAVVLSPTIGADQEGFRGGEFLFCDVPENKKGRRQEIPAGLGDAILFCTRDRLVRVGGAYGLQPVKHGVNTITEGSRLVLGVPFHDYR